MARGWRCTKLSSVFFHLFLACALCYSFLFVVFVLFLLPCSRWNFVDVSLILPRQEADHVVRTGLATTYIPG